MSTKNIGNSLAANCDASLRAPRFPTFVNENVVRWNALLTVVTLVAAYLTTPWLLVLLVADFAARVITGPKFSPFARSGAAVMQGLGVKPKMIAGAPKRFAAGIGLTLAAITAAMVLLGSPLGWAVGALILVFASLEAFFAFCAGCVLYTALGKIGVVDECPTCIK